MPTIHVKDLARMVKKIFEAPPAEQQYIFGIDNTQKPTQKKLIQAISDGVGTGMVESKDIPLNFKSVHPKQTPLNLHLDWRRFAMLNIKAKPSKIFVPPGGGEEGAEEGEAEGDFNWHCKSGLASNIQLVKDEFCKERGLKPFKILLTGQVLTGKTKFSKELAKSYQVPHISVDQIMKDVQTWTDEKENAYIARVENKKRLADLAEQRKREKEEAEEVERKAEEERIAAAKAEAAAAGEGTEGDE